MGLLQAGHPWLMKAATPSPVHTIPNKQSHVVPAIFQAGLLRRTGKELKTKGTLIIMAIAPRKATIIFFVRCRCRRNCSITEGLVLLFLMEMALWRFYRLAVGNQYNANRRTTSKRELE
jgi:hypothetical protein